MGGSRVKLVLLSPLLFLVTGTFGVTYRTYKLEDYCNNTLTLPCPGVSSYGSDRGGTSEFYFVPNVPCAVKVTFSSSCYSLSSENKFAIYANIRDFIKIYENATGKTPGTLLKQLAGGTAYAGTNPASAGQFKTRFAKRPIMTFKYVPGSLYDYSYQASFDYNVVQHYGDSHLYNDKYCSSLTGYIHEDLMCDTTPDRVNCPNSYSSLPVSSAAQSFFYCSFSSNFLLESPLDSSSDSPTDSPSDSSSDSSSDSTSGSFSGSDSGSSYGCSSSYCSYDYNWSNVILFGLVTGSTCLIALISVCVRAFDRRTQQTTWTGTGVRGPVVVGTVVQIQSLANNQGSAPYPVKSSTGGLAPLPSYTVAMNEAYYPVVDQLSKF